MKELAMTATRGKKMNNLLSLNYERFGVTRPNSRSVNIEYCSLLSSYYLHGVAIFFDNTLNMSAFSTRFLTEVLYGVYMAHDVTHPYHPHERLKAEQAASQLQGPWR